MSNDNVFKLKNPGGVTEVRDALTEVLREGARALLSQAIEAEVAEFLGRYREERDAAGRLRMVPPTVICPSGRSRPASGKWR